MVEDSKVNERRVTLNQLTHISPRPIDQLGFHNFIRNHAFRKKLYNAFCSLLEDDEGKIALEAFRAIVERRMGQPWTPEYAGGMTMALIAAVNKYDSNDLRSFYKGNTFPREALDDDFIARLKKGFNELCNSYAVYSLAVIENWSFLNKIKEMGKNTDSVTEEELRDILRAGIAQYAQRNQY